MIQQTRYKLAIFLRSHGRFSQARSQFLVHDKQLVDEQLLTQREVGITLLAHSGIPYLLANTHCMFSDAHTVDMQERCFMLDHKAP